MPDLKVFISYSNRDRRTAELLYRDLNAAGADPYEFTETGMADTSVWSEIVAWIGQCDAFIVLISASSLASRPVQDEIKIAHHRHVNRGGQGKGFQAQWQPLYRGPIAGYSDLTRVVESPSYRVKALGPWGETGWSNVATR